MSRSLRQQKILDLISKYEIKSQEELAAELQKLSFKTTQATISRDIKELGLVKVMTEGKTYKYAKDPSFSAISPKLLSVFKESVLSIQAAESLLVIKTLQGAGQVVANVLTKLDYEQILGCIAGEDCVFAALKSNAHVLQTQQLLYNLLD